MTKIANKFLDQTDKLYQEFVKKYYPELEYDLHCYPVGRNSKWMHSVPWPLDVDEGTCRYTLDDVFVALYNEIPKEIVLEWYEKHVEDYEDEETYRKINLYHYRRSNYDKKTYEMEQAKDLENSRKAMLESSYLLDKELWQPIGTFWKSMNDDHLIRIEK